MSSSSSAAIAAEYKRDECDSCHAGIIWAVTTNGINQPVDYEPAYGGNIALERRGGKVRSRVVKTALTYGRTDLRWPHHATCPHAASYRRRKR